MARCVVVWMSSVPSSRHVGDGSRERVRGSDRTFWDTRVRPKPPHSRRSVRLAQAPSGGAIGQDVRVSNQGASVGLSHVAMSVPVGTLTDRFRANVLAFGASTSAGASSSSSVDPTGSPSP